MKKNEKTLKKSKVEKKVETETHEFGPTIIKEYEEIKD